MRLLIRVVVFVAVLLVGLVGIGFLLSDQVHVERRAEIAAPPAALYAVLNSFDKFEQWSPWAGLDPAMKVEISGPPAGVGARYAWHGNAEVGSGSQEIIATTPDRSVTLKLVFDGFEHPSTTVYGIEPNGEGSVVTWSMDADLGHDPVMRYVGLVMKKEIEVDYDKGLARLKTLAEALPAPSGDAAAPAAEPTAAPSPEGAGY